MNVREGLTGMNRRQEHAVLLGVIAAFLLVTATGAAVGALEWDEGSFLMNAEYLQGTDINQEPTRPAALSYLVAAAWQVTGEHVVVARLIVVLFGLATLLAFHRLAADEFADPLPLTATFALTPLLLYWSFHVYTDVPALFFVLAGLYAYRKDQHLIAGALMAVAATFRYVFIVFAAGMALAYLWERRAYIHEYTLGGVVGAVPLLVESTRSFGAPLTKPIRYTEKVAHWSGSGPLAAVTGNATSAVLMLSALLPAAATGWRKTPLVEKSMVLAYGAFFLFLSANTFYRYWLPAVPFLLLMAYRGLPRNWFAIAAVVMIAVSGVYVGSTAADLQECSVPFMAAVDFVSEREGIVVTNDRWAIAAYVLDRKVYSDWTGYQRLHDVFYAEYAITTDTLALPLEATFGNDCRTYRVYRLV